MIIAIGNDHHGFAQKLLIKEQFDLPKLMLEWFDVGSFEQKRVDYPHYGIKVARAVAMGEAQFGILLCGTGVGMSIVANRFKGVYAALVWNSELARKSKEDDNANILVIPSDYIDEGELLPMIEAWMKATFKGGRYQERLDTIDELGGVK